jgi:hypothetical protein
MKKLNMMLAAKIKSYEQFVRFTFWDMDKKTITHLDFPMNDSQFQIHTFDYEQLQMLRDWCDEVLKDSE